MSKEKEKPKLSILSRGWVEIAAAIFLGLGLIGFGIGGYALYMNGSINHNAKFDLVELSNFGGLIAGLSGFFTLGSVLLFYRALGLQREDIQNNLKAFSDNTKVLKGQHGIQELVRFETTFFSIYNLLLNEMKSFEFMMADIETYHGRGEKGLKCFDGALNGLIEVNKRIEEGKIKDFFYEIDENVYKWFYKKNYSLTIICEIIHKALKVLSNSSVENDNIYIELLINSMPDSLKDLMGYYTVQLKHTESGLLMKAYSQVDFAKDLIDYDDLFNRPVKRTVEIKEIEDWAKSQNERK